jgi:hypothetical protein
VDADAAVPFDAREVRESLDLPRVVHDRREIPRHDLLEPIAPRPVVAAHDEDRDPDPRVAQLDRFFEERHAEPRDPGPFQCARHGGGAMPVRVRLEHPPDLRLRRTRDRPLEHAKVVPEVGQVHLGPGRPDCVRRRRPTGPEHAHRARAMPEPVEGRRGAAPFESDDAQLCGRV